MSSTISPSIKPKKSNIKWTTELFVERAKAIHGDKLDYTNTVYTNAQTKVSIRCPEHGEFFQIPRFHLKHTGCPVCQRGGRPNIRVTTEEFIERAKKVHGDKYDYSNTVYKTCDVRVKVGCPIHGEFMVFPHNHLSGSICLKCQHDSYKQTPEKFVSRAKEIHGDKYEYDEVDYINSQTKVKIRCKRHGIFEQKPNCHVNQKQGCRKCFIENSRSNTVEFIERANEVHNFQYDYSKTIYVGSMDNITVTCKLHGDFLTTPNRHLMGNGYNKTKIAGCGCPKCGIETTTSNTEEFVARASEIHRGLYNYDEVDYTKCFELVKIRCEKHGIFEQTPSSHLGGTGCPVCNNSKGEQKIYDILTEHNINIEPQKRFDDCRHVMPLAFDFYLPDHNTLIEFDGVQHFESVEFWGGEVALAQNKLRDSIKNTYCEENDIKLIRIPYYDYDNIETILEDLIT